MNSIDAERSTQSRAIESQNDTIMSRQKTIVVPETPSGEASFPNKRAETAIEVKRLGKVRYYGSVRVRDSAPSAHAETEVTSTRAGTAMMSALRHSAQHSRAPSFRRPAETRGP